MTLTANQQKLSDLYEKNFGTGRTASFGTKGGADYWLDTHNPQTDSDWNNIDSMLAGSDEGKKYAASVAAGTPTVLPGGIDPTKSLSSQAGEGTWASHFTPGGVFANQDGASAIKNIAKDIGFGTTEDDGTVSTPPYFNTGVTDQTGADDTGTTIPPAVADGWWNQFDDADAFKEFLQGDQTDTATQSGGMDDFMKFMMLMSIMPSGGGGYGGGQYGYGGMNPGGVQSAYNPWANMQQGWDFMKTAFGSGDGGTSATTDLTNAT